MKVSSLSRSVASKTRFCVASFKVSFHSKYSLWIFYFLRRNVALCLFVLTLVLRIDDCVTIINTFVCCSVLASFVHNWNQSVSRRPSVGWFININLLSSQSVVTCWPSFSEKGFQHHHIFFCFTTMWAYFFLTIALLFFAVVLVAFSHKSCIQLNNFPS